MLFLRCDYLYSADINFISPNFFFSFNDLYFDL